MKPVFQTIVDKGSGNCMQSAIASLLDLKLEDVPDFIREGVQGTNQSPTILMDKFLHERGYSLSPLTTSVGIESVRKALEIDGGIGGYWYASVWSQTLESTTHAVIVDKTCTVVHDPNPNGRCLGKGIEIMLSVHLVQDLIVMNDGRVITDDEWLKEIAE